MFCKDDVVEYCGKQTRHLFNRTGIVQRHQKTEKEMIPVVWDNGGFFGVFPHNIKVLFKKEPDWRI